MSALSFATMANETRSYYLRASSVGSGVPSPFSIIDETGPAVGSRLLVTDVNNEATLANLNASGDTIGALTFQDDGSVTIASDVSPPVGYNFQVSDANTRVHQPLVVQSGSVSGLVMSNTLTGTGVIANNAGGQPTNSGIFLNSTGTVTINNGNLVCGSNLVALGVQNSGFPAIVANGGSNLQWWSNSTTVDANIARASAGILNINAQSNLATTISGATMIYTSSTGTDMYGNVNFPTNNATYDYNNGSLRYMSAIAMNNGGTIGGVGTINMVNGSGAGSGTINGLSNINTAGLQDITITGYNPSNPTPTITLGSEGNISNANAIADTNLNGTTMTYGSTATNPQGGIRTYYNTNIPANSTTFQGFRGAGLWMFSAQSTTNPAGWSFTLRLFSPSNAQDLLSVGSPPGWFFNNTAPYSFDAGLAGSSDLFTVTATRLGAW